MATASQLAPGQSKIEAGVRKDGQGRVAVTFITRTKWGQGIDSEKAHEIMNAMIEAAKLTDAKHYAEDVEEASFIETPLYSPAHGKVIEQRLMLNEDEFVPFGVRDPNEGEDIEAMEQWD